MQPALTQPGCEVERPCKAHKKNLATIMQAAKNGDLALMECRLKSTGEILAVLCAVGRDGHEAVFTPFAAMFNGNPYEMLEPPNPDGGFYSE